MNGYAPILRPWLKAGLSALLLESEERVKTLLAMSRDEDEGKAAAAGRTPEPEPYAVRRERTAAPSVAQFSRGSASLKTLPPFKTQPASIASVPQGAERSPSLENAAPPGVLPETDWPAPWQALKKRRPLPPSPLVLWTYDGLGEDLMGTADPDRQQAIVRMILALKHPGGTHVFWPYALPGVVMSTLPSLFWSGVERLDPRVLLIFGSNARDALSLPHSLQSFCQELVYGRLVIQLPDPKNFSGDAAAFARVLAFLAHSLRFCSRR